MLSLAAILFGAAFTLGAAYGIGALILRGHPAPPEIALAAGSVLLSTAVFVLFAAGAGGRNSFAVLGATALATLFWRQLLPAKDPPVEAADRLTRAVALSILACFGLFYLVHALAPEIEPDGVTYHLGLVSEYLRLHGFPDRVGFYEILPQGMEMLYAVAYAFGGGSSAKLVHFAFLLATVPLLLRTGRRLGVSDRACWLAAVLYFCAPVTGVTGASTYTDAAVVFFLLAALYLLLAWDRGGGRQYLLAAGLTAGFSYSIKLPGLWTLLLAAGFVLARRRAGALAWLAGGSLVAVAPWMGRSLVWTGNPLAPLFNRWFPNAYFHVFMDRILAQNMASYGGVRFWEVPYELAVGGRLAGIFGPLLLALPLGLLALRRREVRWCWLLAAAVGLPWFWNIGARFFMPAFVFLALAFAAWLPRRAVWAVMTLEAVLCAPPVLAAYETQWSFRLRDLPWRAALRIEPESQYLQRVSAEYRIARMIESSTRPDERIFALRTSPRAYIDRETLEFWHSALADTLLDTLRVAGVYQNAPFYDISAEWPSQPVKGVSFRLLRAHPGEWCVHELRFYSGGDLVYPTPEWQLRAWPNRWETPFAFDRNLATRWRTWEPMRPGMYLETDFDRPQTVSRVVMASHTPVYGVPFEVYVQGLDGKWRLATGRPAISLRPREDLRFAATRALRAAGFACILAPSGDDGNGPMGEAMAADSAAWGLRVAGHAEGVYLFRIE